MSEKDPPPRWVTPALFAGLVLFGALTAGDVPWSDDARFYVRAAVNHGRWIERIVQLDFDAFSRAGVERAFRFNAEHPSVGKLAMGASWLLLHEWLGLLDEVNACRAAVILLWALMGVAVFAFLRREVSLAAALFAAASLTAMPRLLYHAHAETLDLPISALITLTALFVWRCLERPRLQTGAAAVLFFGLALATKLNAPFLLAGVFLYWIALHPPRAEDRIWLRLPRVPLVLLGLLLLSPLVAYLAWPWIWFDTFARLNTYFLFHFKHYAIHYYWGGTLFGEQVAPWYAPAVMTALTLPVPLLALCLLAAYRPLWRTLATLPFGERLSATARPELAGSSRHRLEMFVLLQALVQLAAVSLPNVPKYGGVKLFLPMLPFVAILLGLGFDRIVGALRENLPAARHTAAIAATAVVLLLPGWSGAALHRGAWLSYYNVLAGGLRGATEAGYERQYYDVAYPELARELNRALPNGGSVAVLPNPKEYTPYFARWQQRGELANTIRLAPPERADLIVLTHERRWAQYPEQLASYRTRPLLHRHELAGVPLFSIFDLR